MVDALEFLHFAALSTTVHADALQCLLDDTHAALYQMTADAERLEALEQELSALLKEQRRIHAMREVVSRSRDVLGDKTVGPTFAVKKTPRVSEAKEMTKSSCAFLGVGDVLRFASSALVEGGDEMDVSAPTKMTVEGRAHSVTQKSFVECEDEKNIDGEVERAKLQIRNLERISVKTKLRGLEALKQRVKDIDANGIMERYVEPFCFSNEVEDLWCSKNSLNAKNIDYFIAQACQRFSARYEDALSAISDFPMNENGSHAQLFSSLLYAESLTSQRNLDIAAVQTLQGIEKESLVQYYDKLKRMATVNLVIPCSSVDTVLGSEEFSLLPRDWWDAQLLLPPVDTFLPPVRHILTPRFSFADVNELKILQSLRIAFQRDVLNVFINLPKAVNDIWQRLRAERAQQKGETEEERNFSAAVVRLTAGKSYIGGNSSSGGAAWTTLAHCFPEE